MYAKEVASGKLEWSPSHKSENFWRDNHLEFGKNNFEPLKQLVALLRSPEGDDINADSQTLSIAW